MHYPIFVFIIGVSAPSHCMTLVPAYFALPAERRQRGRKALRGRREEGGIHLVLRLAVRHASGGRAVGIGETKPNREGTKSPETGQLPSGGERGREGETRRYIGRSPQMKRIPAPTPVKRCGSGPFFRMAIFWPAFPRVGGRQRDNVRAEPRTLGWGMSSYSGLSSLHSWWG